MDKTNTIFTDRQIRHVALSWQAQVRMGYPSVHDIVDGIGKKYILNLLHQNKLFMEPTQINVDKKLVMHGYILYRKF